MLKYSDCVKNRELLLKYIWASNWKYKRDMKYWISYFHQNEYMIIHKWDITDLASTPCFVQCIIPKEKFLISCIHDEWYSLRDTFIYIEDRNNLSLRFKELEKYWEWIDDYHFLPNKQFWDLIFLHWMQEENLVFYWENSKKPYLWYLAVKYFWNSHYKSWK